MPDDCLFCRIVAGDLAATIVLENEHAVAFDDLNPQAPTHVLIVPRRHIATLNDLQAGDQAVVGELLTMARDVARERGLAAAGYRTVFNCNADAGQTVFHLHLHLLGGRKLGWPPG
jgi:histidine triad (HIT) family protein